jgi:hypothetical protein
MTPFEQCIIFFMELSTMFQLEWFSTQYSTVTQLDQ